ncbi:MAG: hypothetical protein D6698_07180, partial [Gammaproteobacteria bacterium]
MAGNQDRNGSKKNEPRPLKQRLLSAGGWGLFFKALGAVLGLAVYSLLARLLSKEDMGVYFLAFSVVTFMATVMQAGMSKTALKLVAGFLARKKTIYAEHALRATFRFVLTIGLVLAMLWLVILNDWVSGVLFHSPQLAALGGWTACWFFLFAVVRFMSESFRGAQDFFHANLFTGPATSIISFVLLGYYYLGGQRLDLDMAVAIMVVATALASCLAMLRLNRRLPLCGPARLVPAREYGPIAWPIFITNLALLAVSQADLWVMGSFAPKDEVAIYGAALRTVLLIGIASLIINSALQPMIVELYSQGKKRKLERVIGKVTLLVSAIALVMFVAVLAVGDKVLLLLFGPRYAEGWGVLVILSLGRTVAVCCGPCGQCLMLGGHQRLMMMTTLGFAVLSVVTSIFLVRPFG